VEKLNNKVLLAADVLDDFLECSGKGFEGVYFSFLWVLLGTVFGEIVGTGRAERFGKSL